MDFGWVKNVLAATHKKEIRDNLAECRLPTLHASGEWLDWVKVLLFSGPLLLKIKIFESS
jgi:hypothetical protein